MKRNNSIAQTKESQAKLSAADGLSMLIEGNNRFLSGRPLKRNLIEQVKATATGQYPFASVVSCTDSRIPTELIFDQGVGDIFNTRIAGNFVNPDILGTLEFAAHFIGSKILVIMGHTSCGAVQGACDDVKLGNLTKMLGNIMPAIKAINTAEGVDRSSANLDFVKQVAEKNVTLSIDNVRKNSEVLNTLEHEGKLLIVGAMYDVASGKVTFMNE